MLILNFQIGNQIINIKNKSIHSIFIVEGKIKLKSFYLTKGSFIKVENLNFLNLKVIENSKVFEIISPSIPSYRTYSQFNQRSKW